MVLLLTKLLKFPPPPQPSPHIGRTPESQTEVQLGMRAICHILMGFKSFCICFLLTGQQYRDRFARIDALAITLTDDVTVEPPNKGQKDTLGTELESSWKES